MANEGLKESAHELSSFANNAYQILTNDIARAEYLIRVMTGIDLQSEELSESGHVIHDEDLVERIFELRMTISESISLLELNEIKLALERDYKEEIKRLTDTFTVNGAFTND